MKKFILSILLALTLLSQLLSPALAAETAEVVGTFSDVVSTDWFFKYVSELSTNKVLNGYPDGTFKPENTVTYGEALKLIILAAGYDQQAQMGSHWASGYLNFAISKGYVEPGYIQNLGDPAPRLQIARIASKALNLTAPSIKSPFADTKSPYVLSLYDKGIVEGSYNADKVLVFLPDSNIERSEISAIIWRINNMDKTDTGSSVTPVSKITYGKHVLDILKDVPVNSYNPNNFYLSNGVMQYRSTTVQTYSGIDVSRYQGTIDWKKVKAAGISFAIIRLGYRGYETGSLNLDESFEQNIKGATEAGIDVGVYFFSQAITEKEAIEEADFVLAHIGKYKLTYPVVFDWEVIGGSDARTDNMDTNILCQAAAAFCKKVSDAGYKPMIYFNSYCGYLKYNLSKIANIDFWFAQYSEKPTFYYNFQMWQYTSSGKVDGIAGNVDMNISFKKYS